MGARKHHGRIAASARARTLTRNTPAAGLLQDDANDDPQWSETQILTANFEFNGRRVGQHEYNLMKRTTAVVFRILERAWRRHGCVLVDMKVRERGRGGGGGGGGEAARRARLYPRERR